MERLAKSAEDEVLRAMNIKSLIAAVLILAAGCVATAALLNAWHKDLLFYFYATQQKVFVERTDIRMERITDPIHAAHSYEVDAALTIRAASGRRVVRELFSGGRQAAEDRARRLRSLEKASVEFYLDERTPRHFALDLAFPWKRLLALFVTLLVLVAPSAVAIAVFCVTRWRTGTALGAWGAWRAALDRLRGGVN